MLILLVDLGSVCVWVMVVWILLMVWVMLRCV